MAGVINERCIMFTPLRPLSVLCLVLSALALLLCAAAAHQGTGGLPPQPASGGTRGPSAIVFRPDGRVVYVAEQDEGQVAALDADSGRVLARIPSGGKQPVALALAADGRTLLVANQFSGSLGILDLETNALRATVPLPGGPSAVAIAPGGEAFVALNQLNQVAVVDPNAAKVVERIPLGEAVRHDPWGTPWPSPAVSLGQRPRALAVTPDGSMLLCANATGGSISLIDVAGRREVGCFRLAALNLRGIGLSPDGRLGFVAGQQPNQQFSAARPEETWRNVVCVLRVEGATTRPAGVLALDQGSRGAADPGGIVAMEGRVMVALGGTHEVAVFQSEGAEGREIDAPVLPGGLRRTPAGANPRALAVRPGSDEVWVANHLGNSLTVLSGDGSPRRVIPLEPPARPDIKLRGRFLFSSAHLTRGGRFTCGTCHLDGNTEGLSWRFAHVKDGLARRNSRNLRGTVLLTAPYRWVPREEDFEEFVNDEIAGLFGTPKRPHGDLHALWELVNELPLPPNPHRSSDGILTPAAVRGKALFAGAAGCAGCHGGLERGGTGKKAWIGTTPGRLELDVPHLTGVYDSAPYLHDGRAPTLESLFTEQNAGPRHGKAHLLTPEQLRDLLQYVREL